MEDRYEQAGRGPELGTDVVRGQGSLSYEERQYLKGGDKGEYFLQGVMLKRQGVMEANSSC